jgi:hypothetical protein
MNKDLLLMFLQMFPDGKTKYPIEIVVDKLGDDIQVNVKMHLTNREKSAISLDDRS